jgi:hypothetical protein
MAMRTCYRVCSRIRATDLPAATIDAMLLTLKTSAVDGAVITFRRQLCHDRRAAEMLLRTASAEFPGGEHWLQVIRFDKAWSASMS